MRAIGVPGTTACESGVEDEEPDCDEDEDELCARSLAAGATTPIRSAATVAAIGNCRKNDGGFEKITIRIRRSPQV
jgi:hypothetical protein